jgi:hypothetical protein
VNALPPAVIHPVTVDLIGPHGVAPVESEMQYDPLDPYAVTVVFHRVGHDVEWVFGRDLLIRGLHEPSGEGDVHLFPSVGPDGRAVVVLELRSPDGTALVEAPSRDVMGFLARTTHVVWPGTEAEYLALDAAIESILVESAG